MSNKENDNAITPIKMNFFFLVSFWTIVLGFSLGFNIYHTYDNAKAAALIQARTAFEKDIIYRRWNSNLNGIYVPITPKTPQNPYLVDSDRNVTTTDGLKLTKINPAYMTRLIYEMGSLDSGVLGRTISNLPIHPENLPNEWEAKALKSLAQGVKEEISEVTLIENKEYLNFFKVLKMEKSCMSCHAFQGYSIGEIRGGISVSVPIAPFMGAVNRTVYMLVISHLIIWIMGMWVLLLSARRLLKNEVERKHAQELKFQLEKRVQEGIAEVEKKQTALQTFMKFTEALVYLKDTNYRYTMSNNKYKLLTKPHKNIEEQADDESILEYEEVYNKIHAYEKIVLNTQQPVHPKEVFSFDNSGRLYMASMFPVLNSNKQMEGIGAMFFDITQRIHLEKDIMAAKEEAEHANMTKSAFLANVSHEIRNPLNGVIGMTDLLIRTVLTEDQASMVNTIKNGGATLLNVLNDILDFSKIEAGKIYLDPASFSLCDIAFDTVKVLAPAAHKKNIEIVVNIAPHMPDYLLGDASRINQILLNLVSNAIKFTEKGTITLAIHLLQQKNNKVSFRISVIDTGIGIFPEKQQDIFLAFEQADSSTTRQYGGTGLGLAISSRLVELMDSEFHLQSQPGVGSTFWFDLTLPLADQHSLPCLGVSTEGLKGIKVLTIDHSNITLCILSVHLKAWGMKIEQSTNVAEAIHLLTTAVKTHDKFSLVLTDLQPPEKDGLNLVNEMQDNSSLKEIPIIMLSTENLMDTKLRDIALVTNLTKPIRPVELMNAIASALGLCELPDIDTIQQNATKYAQLTSSINLKILLVDDMEINQIVISKMLRSLGHKVIMAENGQKALELLSEEYFDMIFMDVQMPVMDGVQATKIIREKEAGDPSGRRLPIIAMTAHAMKGDKEKYIGSGMDDYLSKPVLLEEIAKIIDKRLKCSTLAHWLEHTKTQIQPDKLPAPIDSDINDDSMDKDDDIFDYTIISKTFTDNEELIVKTMEIYLCDAPPLINEMEEAIRNNDNLSLSTNSHTLKGITSYFCKSKAFKSCFALESIGREHKLPESLAEAKHQISMLAEEINIIKAKMKDYISGRL